MPQPPSSFASLGNGLLNCAAAASAITAAAAGIVAAACPALDAINQIAPFAFLGALGVLATTLVIWRRRLDRHPASLAAAGFAVLLFQFMLAQEAIAGLLNRWIAPAATADTITVVTLNLWQGGPWEARAVDYLIATDADFVVLQETGFLYRPGLQRLRQAYPFVIESIAAPYAQVALLSRRAPETVNMLAGAAWSLAAAHQPSRRLRWTEATFVAHGTPLRLVGLHARRDGGPAATAAELDAISRILAERADPSTLIVAGDFNMTSWTHTLHRFGHTARARRATRQIATFPAPARGAGVWPFFAIFAIDHQFYGARWRPVAVRRGPDVGSDHYPVAVTYAPVAAP